jgi:hypothetical protein
MPIDLSCLSEWLIHKLAVKTSPQVSNVCQALILSDKIKQDIEVMHGDIAQN